MNDWQELVSKRTDKTGTLRVQLAGGIDPTGKVRALNCTTFGDLKIGDEVINELAAINQRLDLLQSAILDIYSEIKRPILNSKGISIDFNYSDETGIILDISDKIIKVYSIDLNLSIQAKISLVSGNWRWNFGLCSVVCRDFPQGLTVPGFLRLESSIPIAIEGGIQWEER